MSLELGWARKRERRRGCWMLESDQRGWNEAGGSVDGEASAGGPYWRGGEVAGG